MKVKLGFELCNEFAKLPEYKHDGDAGMDMYAAEDRIIRAGETVGISTGIKLLIPKGYEVQLRPRSGISLNTRLRLPNSPATIDSGYRDEIKVIMWNSSPDECLFPDGLNTYKLDVKGSPLGHYSIQKGDRICQLVLKKVETAVWAESSDLEKDELVEDRQGGLGHSGIR